MDPGVSVQKQNFTRNPEKPAKSSWNPRGSLKSFTLTIPLEFGKACEDLSWNHCTSTPHRSETNGIAERAVRRVKEGTSAVLLQSGPNESWWADSMECYTYLRNVTDLLSDGKTPHERRFGQPFKGPIIPFGSLVEYHPITAKDQSRIHQFGKKVLPGLFLGYALYAGGIWKGDVLVADLEELETMDASEIYSKRLNAKEVIISHRRRIYFSNRRWTNQKPWRSKIMDIISRLPGCDGQAAEAVSAYTQVKMEDAHKLLKIPKLECPDIWIRLPRHKWPKSWFSMEDPVVPLERNLYGHPLAGLLWERQFEKILLKHGWEKIPNWKCIFVHRERGLFLSVFVGDIKLAGKHRSYVESTE